MAEILNLRQVATVTAALADWQLRHAHGKPETIMANLPPISRKFFSPTTTPLDREEISDLLRTFMRAMREAADDYVRPEDVERLLDETKSIHQPKEG